MARMSIYVPDDLKGRMDRLNDRVNWSGVAQAAFEIEIGLYPEWKENRMNAVVERLRASKQKHAAQDISWGVNAGRKWAEEDAEYEQLFQLGKLRDLDDDEDCRFDELPRLLHPEEEVTPQEFWETILGPDDKWSSPFQIGFIRGAKAVWEEVEDKL